MTRKITAARDGATSVAAAEMKRVKAYLLLHGLQACLTVFPKTTASLQKTRVEIAGGHRQGVLLLLGTGEWVATGLNIGAWTVNRRYRRDQLIALGVAGFFSDDPAYLSRDLPFLDQDEFVSQG